MGLSWRVEIGPNLKWRDGDKNLIVVAGGHYTEGGRDVYLDSVEIYDPTDNTWHSGKTNSQPSKNTFLIYYFQPNINQNA